MNAIVVEPGVSNSIQMRTMPDPVMSADQVAVRMIRVGLCGTDSEINRGLYGKAPDGEQFLILGHENFGVVEDVGREVAGFAAGDLVVSTVRRPCGVCPQCAAGESDMCSSGQYTERGIMRRHGFMAERYVEHPVYLNKIPPEIRDIAVLLEPMSIVEKGVEQAFLLQRRFSWTPRAGMVLGAGPVGLLAAAVLRRRGLETTVVGREETSDLRAQIATQLGAKYISVATRPLADVVTDTGFPDLIVEATGNAGVAFSAMSLLALNGVLCLLSVTGGHAESDEPIDVINQRLVLGNRVVFGSVNANKRHFQHGVEDFVAIEKAWPGALQRMLTDRIPWEQHRRWFTERGSGIKATLEIGR
ncbi:MAG: glucose 1-dehydrogenase [Vicinamibacterales bacterium]